MPGPQRLTDRALLFLEPVRVLFAAFVVAASFGAAAQEVADTSADTPRGIRFALYLSIRSEPGSHFLSQATGGPLTATLTVKIRISSHSQETNFYGDVPATVSDFDPVAGSTEREIWSDAKCHHERGFPKTSLINVEGSIRDSRNVFPVSARYRWLGLLLPGDEIIQARRIAAGTDDIGPFTVTRTETKKSRLFVDLKLYTLACDLPAAQPPAEPNDKPAK